MGFLLLSLQWIMISVEHMFLFVNSICEHMFATFWKSLLSLTFYPLPCPINCTFSNKKTTNMHPCELHISGLVFSDIGLWT